MNKSDLKIIYMGTPEFAVAPLRALVEGGYRVTAVVTMPDKPIGRGMKLQSSPVKQYALEVGIPVLQPQRLKDEGFLAELASYRADLQIVVAFRMLPDVVWSMPPMGTFNLHASLLPRYRGAAPINWALINGETRTGVTTFMLEHEIDTGNILLQESVEIGPDENAGSLHDRLMDLGARLVPATVDRLIDGSARALPQDRVEGLTPCPAPKLFKDNTAIDWNRPAAELHNLVRGLSPYPAAWTWLCQPGQSEPLMLKVLETAPEPGPCSEPAGSLVVEGRKGLKVAVADGYLRLLRLQLAGRKAMSAADLLNGYPMAEARLKGPAEIGV